MNEIFDNITLKCKLREYEYPYCGNCCNLNMFYLSNNFCRYKEEYILNRIHVFIRDNYYILSDVGSLEEREEYICKEWTPK